LPIVKHAFLYFDLATRTSDFRSIGACMGIEMVMDGYDFLGLILAACIWLPFE
jgi:hypothetical protein